MDNATSYFVASEEPFHVTVAVTPVSCNNSSTAVCTAVVWSVVVSATSYVPPSTAVLAAANFSASV